MGLRLAKGLDLTTIPLTTGFDLSDLVNKNMLERLIEGGLLEIRGKHLAATLPGWLTLNAVTRALLIEPNLGSN